MYLTLEKKKKHKQGKKCKEKYEDITGKKQGISTSGVVNLLSNHRVKTLSRTSATKTKLKNISVKEADWGLERIGTWVEGS